MGHELADQLARLVDGQLLQLHASERAAPFCAFQLTGDPVGNEVRTERERDQHRCGRRSAQQRQQQLPGSGVSPVDVVEHEHQRLVCGEPLQQQAHRSMAAKALTGQRRCCPALHGGQYLAQLREHVSSERRKEPRLAPAEILVERIDEHPEGDVAVELRTGARQREMVSGVGPFDELGEKAGLADSGLADESNHASSTRLERRE